MEQTTLSPEAVEALAKSLAAKMESHKGAVGDLADQLLAFQEEDKKFKLEDAAFKREMRAGLGMMKAARIDVPLIAVGLSLVSIVFASIALIGTARASQRVSDEIRVLSNDVAELRQKVGNDRRETPSH